MVVLSGAIAGQSGITTRLIDAGCVAATERKTGRTPRNTGKTAVKTIEIVQARGLSIIIDGMQPAKSGWSFGEGHGEKSEIIVADNIGGDYLTIGPYKLRAIRSDEPLEEAYVPSGDRPSKLVNVLESYCPTNITLVLADGTEVTAKVVEAVTGDEETGPVMVTLTDSTTREIDEITLYLKAEVI